MHQGNCSWLSQNSSLVSYPSCARCTLSRFRVKLHCSAEWRDTNKVDNNTATVLLLPVSLDEYVLARTVKRHAVHEGNGKVAVQELRDS